MAKHHLFDKLFRDKHGSVVFGQKPNAAIQIWLVCWIISMFPLEGDFLSVVHFVGTAFLFAWGYMEIISGHTLFRRILGIGVIIYIIAAEFF